MNHDQIVKSKRTLHRRPTPKEYGILLEKAAPKTVPVDEADEKERWFQEESNRLKESSEPLREKPVQPLEKMDTSQKEADRPQGKLDPAWLQNPGNMEDETEKESPAEPPARRSGFLPVFLCCLAAACIVLAGILVFSERINRQAGADGSPQQKAYVEQIGKSGVTGLGTEAVFICIGSFEYVEQEKDQQEMVEQEKAAAESYEYPADALYFNGHHYYIYNDVDTSWEDALEQCKSRGGYLAVINDANENEVLYQYMTGLGYDEAFFGITRNADGRSWGYTYGDTSSFLDWGINSKGIEEPNNSGGKENHAELDIYMHSGHWNDASFGSQVYTPEGKKYKDLHAYICEWDG